MSQLEGEKCAVLQQLTEEALQREQNERDRQAEAETSQADRSVTKRKLEQLEAERSQLRQQVREAEQQRQEDTGSWQALHCAAKKQSEEVDNLVEKVKDVTGKWEAAETKATLAQCDLSQSLSRLYKKEAELKEQRRAGQDSEVKRVKLEQRVGQLQQQQEQTEGLERMRRNKLECSVCLEGQVSV